MLESLIWNVLEEAKAPGNGVVAMRLHPESQFNIFAVLNQTTGHRFLVLKSDDSRITRPEILPAGGGFVVSLKTTVGDPEGATSLQLELTGREYADVFDVIGNDVLQNVLKTSDDAAAFQMFLSRISEWQQFLDQLPRGGLSEQVQQGLVAELWFLHSVLLPEINPLRAVGAWAGPKGFAKDFQLPGLAFEVKASTGKQPTAFTISNELQLDASRVGKLLLFCLLLEPVLASGVSLQEMVAAIREDLRSDRDAIALFSQRLLQCGYTELDSDQYGNRYAVRSQHFFEVTDAFPRIVESDLRRGVGSVRYSIQYSECERYRIVEDQARELIRSIPT